jgi:hypothetical protein
MPRSIEQDQNDMLNYHCVHGYTTPRVCTRCLENMLDFWKDRAEEYALRARRRLVELRSLRARTKRKK